MIYKYIRGYLVAVLFTMTMVTAFATEQPIVKFDFVKSTATTTTDTGYGIEAKFMRNAKAVEMGEFKVLSLYDTGYLDLTATFGELLGTLDTATISVYVRVDMDTDFTGDGFYLWSFSDVSDNKATTGRNAAYQLSQQRLLVSSSGYDNIKTISPSTPCDKGRWTHIAYTNTGNRGYLYINGEQIGVSKVLPGFKDLFSGSPAAYCWIGRAPYSGQKILPSSMITEFNVYDRKLTDDELAELYRHCAELDKAYYNGTPGDFTPLKNEIERGKALLNTLNTEEYPLNAVIELRDAISLAETVVKNGVAGSIYVSETLGRLSTAIEMINKYKGMTPPSPTPPGNTDYGFRHPGGLHSQADFDRVKELLANGDPTITKAWNTLKNAKYAKAGVTTYPTETVVRGGSGENYMNAARGAAMAYQNALRWKIDGNTKNADTAVDILMAWARNNNAVGGDTNQSLAAGLYGYQFAEAAELMRDYEGWSREDFEDFKTYMLRVWYPRAADFLRRRHGTWDGSSGGKGERPGHYWSNWGLCNALCLMEIGVLCDDVHIYNQGLSFYKYDHVGKFTEENKSVILNDGLNEFLGNLVPAVSPDSRGPLGYLGQMQESGRDQGHTLMSVGLALDICKVAYNQGEDLFAYMNDRLAAGIEFVAAMNFGDVDQKDLPWVNYNYADCRTELGKGSLQTGPNTEGLGGFRPYWDRVLGYYEGVRGIKMQYSEIAAQKLRGTDGCDSGGGYYGETSGGFDHLGFSTLMDYRPDMALPEVAPIYISGEITYNGEQYRQTNLGGLKYNYRNEGTNAVTPTESITLHPLLPEGMTDSGLWKWDTGETTRDLTVSGMRSHIYRVTYNDGNGREGSRCFTIAVAGDCSPSPADVSYTVNGEANSGNEINILYGSKVQLTANPTGGWTTDYGWDNGRADKSITIQAVTTPRSYSYLFANQGGNITEAKFDLSLLDYIPVIYQNTDIIQATEINVKKGSNLTLGLLLPECMQGGEWRWSIGETLPQLYLRNLQQSKIYSVNYKPIWGDPVYVEFTVLIPGSEIDAVEELPADIDDPEIISEKWYTPDGVMVSKPERGVYIVVRTYTDGTDSAEKILLRND